MHIDRKYETSLTEFPNKTNLRASRMYLHSWDLVEVVQLNEQSTLTDTDWGEKRWAQEPVSWGAHRVSPAPQSPERCTHAALSSLIIMWTLHSSKRSGRIQLWSHSLVIRWTTGFQRAFPYSTDFLGMRCIYSNISSFTYKQYQKKINEIVSPYFNTGPSSFFFFSVLVFVCSFLFPRGHLMLPRIPQSALENEVTFSRGSGQ